VTPRIEDYALIGNGRTAALVSRGGSIDWLCLPRFDSCACFAALLGTARNGCWSLAPARGITRTTRRYRPDTLVLETDFESEGGRVRLVDFMPMPAAATSVIRLVSCVEGEVDMRMELTIRFDYGRQVPWVQRRADGTLTAIAGPHLLALRTPVALHGEDLRTCAAFRLAQGEMVPFVLSYANSFSRLPPALDPQRELDRTQRHWTRWAARCSYQGPWREAVVRSLITLKALTYEPTGGIVAAPTTSLPERLAGDRNWDYRYCWLRDATFTLLSLMAAGYREEAQAWRRWLVHAVAGHPSQLQPVYSVMADNRIEEEELPWLQGFDGAKPVRIGNDAFKQLQLDVFGEVLDALYQARRNRLSPIGASWALQRVLVDQIAALKDKPDQGIWEMRGPPQHHTHSKVMLWTALDRAVASVENYGLEGDVERWRALRSALHVEICDRAFDPELGSFVQAYGSKQLDAATLLIPLVGFLPPSDPRVAGTVAAIQRRLMHDGLLRRYDTASVDDGLPEGEGAFLACSFWLADNLNLQGRTEEALELFQRLLAVRNDVGLLAEQYDPHSRRQLGNFPQGLSHVALIHTALALHAPTRLTVARR
jgi:GH15 family glucan-1,4-alpha-glucosidase